MPIILPPTLIMNWRTLASVNVNSDVSGYGNQSRRQVIAAAALTQVYAPRARVTFRPHGTSSRTISSAYIGMKGASAPNFDGNQVQLTWGGSGSVTLTAGGADQRSDDVPFKYVPGNDIVVSFEVSTAPFDARTATGLGGNYAEYNSPTTGQAGATTGTGFGAATGGQILVLTLVELLV